MKSLASIFILFPYDIDHDDIYVSGSAFVYRWDHRRFTAGGAIATALIN